MRRAAKALGILLYLVLISIVFHFDLLLLWNPLQILLVLTGSLLFYLPGIRFDQKHIDLTRFASCAMTASFIQSMLLMLVYLSTAKNTDTLLQHIALNFRPVLYGLLLWSFCDGGAKTALPFVDETSTADKQLAPPYTKESYSNNYDVFRTLGLTNREAEIAVLVCKGMSNPEIAEELFISFTTVKKHMSNIFEKLEIDRREDLKQFLGKNEDGDKVD